MMVQVQTLLTSASQNWVFRLVTNSLTVLISSLLRPFINRLLEHMRLSKECVFPIIKGLAYKLILA